MKKEHTQIFRRNGIIKIIIKIFSNYDIEKNIINHNKFNYYISKDDLNKISNFLNNEVLNNLIQYLEDNSKTNFINDLCNFFDENDIIIVNREDIIIFFPKPENYSDLLHNNHIIDVVNNKINKYILK